MKKHRLSRLLTFLLPWVFAATGYAQVKKESFEVNGYLKGMPSSIFVSPNLFPPGFPVSIPTQYNDFLIHNRVNVNWHGNHGLRAGGGFRNRMFFGHSATKNDFLYNSLREDPSYANLHFAWRNETSIISAVIDRLWLEWENEKITVRAGRQRVNWGIGLVWNPNDIFNTFNYLDFDYEERPGTDALWAQYRTGDFSSVEVAFSPARQIENSVGAVMYRDHFKSYDVQVFGGYYRGDLTSGFGFAGNLGNASLKNETTFFWEDWQEEVSSVAFASTLSLDYSFKSGVFGQIGYLYNSLGAENPSVLSLIALQEADLSAKNIFPFRSSGFLSATFSFTPLITVNLAAIVTTDLNAVIGVPSLSYSLAQNLDALLIAQIFFAEDASQSPLQPLVSTIFLRLKYSF